MAQVAEEKICIDKWFTDDDKFHKLYPTHIQKLADKHFTPLAVAKSAADFLVTEKGIKVLDIGSGVGKFCLAASHYKPYGLFYGIEQRKDLIDYALKAECHLEMENLSFIHGNFMQLDFAKFDSFYFYNSFYENIDGTAKIDQTIKYSVSLYDYYNAYLFKQLEKMPDGTRVATYHTWENQMPQGYYVVQTLFDNELKFWIKA